MNDNLVLRKWHGRGFFPTPVDTLLSVLLMKCWLPMDRYDWYEMVTHCSCYKLFTMQTFHHKLDFISLDCIKYAKNILHCHGFGSPFIIFFIKWKVIIIIFSFLIFHLQSFPILFLVNILHRYQVPNLE